MLSKKYSVFSAGSDILHHIQKHPLVFKPSEWKNFDFSFPYEEQCENSELFLLPEIFSDKQKSLPSVSRKGLVTPYEARMRKQKTPHDNKTDFSVSFFIRCLGSLIRTNAWYSQPGDWRASQCCSAYALQRSLFSCVGIIARLFVFCNRKNEQIFVFGSIVGI